MMTYYFRGTTKEIVEEGMKQLKRVSNEVALYNGKEKMLYFTKNPIEALDYACKTCAQLKNKYKQATPAILAVDIYNKDNREVIPKPFIKKQPQILMLSYVPEKGFLLINLRSLALANALYCQVRIFEKTKKLDFQWFRSKKVYEDLQSILGENISNEKPYFETLLEKFLNIKVQGN